MPDAQQIAELKTLFPNLSLASEGSVEFVLIEQLTLPEHCQPREVKALLCPHDRDGYPSRLFLDQKVAHRGKGTNWNPNTGSLILGQVWWAVSWKTKAGLTLPQMVIDHLAAFRE